MSHKLGIIGFGGMGYYHFLQIREKLEGVVSVKGVFDVREEQQQLAIDNGLIAYGTRESLLTDPEIDLVLVATPNNFHKDISIDALRHGKNVVCEKPVTLNAEELREVIAVSKQTGKLFTVHQNRRWDRDFRIIMEVVNSGIIGKPYMVESRVQGSKRVLQEWRGRKENGGGMIYDWGIHILDQIMWLDRSKVKEVYCDTFSIFAKEVDDNFKAVIKFESGLNAMLKVETNCFINQPRWNLFCEDGTAEIADWTCSGKIVKLKDESELAWDNVIVYTEAGPTRTMAPRPMETTEELPLPSVNADWTEFYKNVTAAIEGREELIVKPEEALRVMTVIDALFVSAKEGRSVTVNA
ncbi:MAG: Gfo/Idh/MocA family oxidoreductase [Clostridia bacterium]|nr:Gfo/Idh/MocA family oxidoreductase [Clostridia bacterium]